MEQAIADDRIELQRLQSSIWEIPILQRDPGIEPGFAHGTPAKSQHRFRTVDADRRHSGKSVHESNRHIRCSAPQIEHAPVCELREALAKISRDLPMRFAPVLSGVGGGLLQLIHQFRFGCTFHIEP